MIENNYEKFKRKTTRSERLEILKKLPDPFEPNETDPSKMNESDLERLNNIIMTVKKRRSFIEHLHSNREFNNPENIQVYLNITFKKIIENYRIEEIGSNLPGSVYNPYNVVSSPEEYYDGIIRRQNEIILKKQNKKEK